MNGRLPADAATFVFSGIADNTAFREATRGLGCRTVGFRAFSDHYPYTREDVKGIKAAAAAGGATALMTTAKDFVRLPRPLDWHGDLFVADAELVFADRGFEAFIRQQLIRLMG